MTDPQAHPQAAGAAPPGASWLNRLGLHRPELRAWALYDWANSGFVTVIMTAVFPIYYATVAGSDLAPQTATFRYGVSTTLGLAIIAVLSPILGAVADYRPIKKKLLGWFLTLGVASVAGMFFVDTGDWLLASILFIVSNIAVNGSFVFYDAMLPHVAREDEIDRVSTAGYALGYIGGGLLLALNLAWIMKPSLFGLPGGTLPTRLAFLSVSVWWVIFAIPLFRRVPEPEVTVAPPGAATGLWTSAFGQVAASLREIRRFRHAFLMLLAFLIYNDGIGTIIRMATIYGAEIGLKDEHMIAAIMLTQFVGVPFAFLFGMLAGRIGAKLSIFLSLAAYVGISVLGYYMKSATEFLILAVLVGMVQGGAQALSRSLFASLIPRQRSGQFFGFFAVVEKFAGIFGPAVFALTLAVTGSSRNAILSVIAFFAAGGVLLWFVDVSEGQRIAREAEGRPACPGCGYLLYGLTEPRCPECGRPFEPALIANLAPPADATGA